MIRIITTFALLSIIGIALSGVAAFGAAANNGPGVSRWISVDSEASLRCGAVAEPAGQSRVAVGEAGGAARIVYGFLACDGSERQLGMDVFVVRASGSFELTVRDHESGETVVRRLRPSRAADFALSGVKLRFTVAEQIDPAS
jgi:hypothetical protein